MNNAELVSRVINTSKAYTKDDHISRRWVLSIAKDVAKTFMAQKLGEMSLNKETNLFSTIKCFEMTQLDKVSCNIVEFKRCNTIMCSKMPLPDMIVSGLGSSVQLVTTLDGKYIDVKPYSTARLSKSRAVQANKPVAYVVDNHLYILDKVVEAVDVVLLAVDKLSVAKCSGCDEGNPCRSIWDFEFVAPDKMLDRIIDKTIQEVLSSKGIIMDANPNLDNNQKSQTVA